MTNVTIIVLASILLVVTVGVIAGSTWAALYYGLGDDDDD